MRYRDRTISGKKVEIAVTKIINGELIENKDALANPESLEQYKNISNKIIKLESFAKNG